MAKDCKVKSATFNGVRYYFSMGEFNGATDTHTSREILINCKPYTQKELITIIHEALHAGNWDKHEETVDRASTEVGRLLWRLGFRRK